jgi:glycine/D-amino acid oxidase-like deaminating enzyme
MLSFWETQSFIQYDYIIIGSGIVGLSTAASILEQKNKARVLILERGLLPSGASTKNAGFICFGSPTEILADLKIMPEDKVLELVTLRYKGVEKLRKRLNKRQTGLEQHGGYELLFEHQHEVTEKLDFLNQLLKPVFKSKAALLLKKESIARFGFSNDVCHLIYLPREAQIDTGKMMHHLIRYVQGLGCKIITGAEVKQININNGIVEIPVFDKVLKKNICFRAQKAAVCTNAFTKKIFPELEINPGRGQVLITKPLRQLQFRGVFHFDEGFYYFRNVGNNRVLLGGGRNLDLKAESTTELTTTDYIIQNLKDKLSRIILPGQPFEIEQSWAGIMAFGNDKFPMLQKINPYIIVAGKMGGMGVAIGSEWGDRAAKMLLHD